MSIYQHYREEEHLFVDQVLSWKDQVERSYVFKRSDFLNPREQKIVRQVIGEKNEDLQLKFFGGNEHVERKRAIIAPFYEELDQDDFDLVLLESSYNDKFLTIAHRDVMGAFLSLGIDRRKLGDIYAADGTVQIVTSEDIVPFVLANLTSIKNANLRFQTRELEQLKVEESNWKTFDRTVSSLRLDAVVKEIYHLSRNDAAKSIERAQVQVNHKIIEDAAFPVEVEDLISVRGKGRSKIIEENGLSRKGRNRITVAILK